MLPSTLDCSIAKFVIFVLLATAAAESSTGGTLKITWSDCGDASTHGKITDLEPTSIEIGSSSTMTGTGTLDEDVSGGTFEIDMTASIISQTWTGDICEAKTFTLPLNMGTVTWQGLDCPVSTGTVTVPIGFQMSSAIPASLASADVSAKGTSTNGDKLLCMDVHLAKQGIAAQALAIACTDADTALWNADTDHSTWQAQMTSCGTKCLGQESCVTSCMEGDGWSSGCAGCFGSLAQCTATNCMTKCINGRTTDCVSCLKAAGCDTAAFGAGSCTGFAEPSLNVEAPIVI
jgi:hypothetical protein